jgi:hypothetical protein
MYFMRKATLRKKRKPTMRMPDFLARLAKIYGRTHTKVRGAKLIAFERGNKGLFVS